jgi:hypothetical protein
MITGEGNVGFDTEGYISHDVNDIKKSESLYTADLIPGIASTAQRIPYLNIPVTAYNPDIAQPSGAYWEPAAELKWFKNANNVLFQEKKELQLEIKVYKKIIKNLLKKK